MVTPTPIPPTPDASCIVYTGCAPWSCFGMRNGERLAGTVVGEQWLSGFLLGYHVFLEGPCGRLYSLYLEPADVMPMPANVVRPIVAQWRARPVETTPDGTQPS